MISITWVIICRAFYPFVVDGMHKLSFGHTQIQLEFYEPDKSFTSSVISCFDDLCTSAVQNGEAFCAIGSSGNACSYSFQYGDGSGTAGFYVHDIMQFDTVTGNSESLNSSAQIVFGYKYLLKLKLIDVSSLRQKKKKTLYYFIYLYVYLCENNLLQYRLQLHIMDPI